MYFGLTGIAGLPFVATGVSVVLLWCVALGLVYPVGARGGALAAAKYLRLTLLVGGVACAGVLAWAVASGQWRTFMRLFGFGPMAEMVVLAFLFVFTMAWMGLTYVSTRQHEEQALQSEKADRGAGAATPDFSAEGNTHA